MWPIWVSYCFHCFLMSEPTIQLRTKFWTFLIDINIFDPGKPNCPKKMCFFCFFYLQVLKWVICWNQYYIPCFSGWLSSSVTPNEYHLSHYHHHHHHGQNRLTYTFAARDNSQRTAGAAGAAVRFWEASAKFDFPTKTRKSQFLSSDSEITKPSFSCDGNFHLIWCGILSHWYSNASNLFCLCLCQNWNPLFCQNCPAWQKVTFPWYTLYTSSSLTGYLHLCVKRQKSQQILWHVTNLCQYSTTFVWDG